MKIYKLVHYYATHDTKLLLLRKITSFVVCSKWVALTYTNSMKCGVMQVVTALLRDNGMSVMDLTQNEMAKAHVRHLAGTPCACITHLRVLS